MTPDLVSGKSGTLQSDKKTRQIQLKFARKMGKSNPEVDLILNGFDLGDRLQVRTRAVAVLMIRLPLFTTVCELNYR